MNSRNSASLANGSGRAGAAPLRPGSTVRRGKEKLELRGSRGDGGSRSTRRQAEPRCFPSPLWLSRVNAGSLMSKATDIRVVAARLYFLPLRTRVPLKFGTETVTSVTCARACLRISDDQGRVAEGWGETPLSVQWVWPSAIP